MTVTSAQSQPLYDLCPSPVGELLLLGDGDALRGLHLQAGPRAVMVDRSWRRAPQAFARARRELGEYFAGERTRFGLVTAPAGTAFQLRVWRALAEIPYGRTIDYGELAHRVGRPGAARAVGLANGRNPISIVVPCHRVIGAGGALTGYGGGIERKRLLLDLERANRPPGTYTLIGADSRPVESTTPGTLGGHRGNRVYGRLDCSGARRWIEAGHYVGQRVFFADEATALAAGYRPCARCLPHRYREWTTARGSAGADDGAPGTVQRRRRIAAGDPPDRALRR